MPALPGRNSQFQRKERVGLDAQQGIVGTLAAIAGIVAHGGALLMPEDRDHAIVEIEDEPRAMLGHVSEVTQQPVSNAMHLLAERGWCLEQEAAQRLRVGETLQPGQVLEGAVGTHERSGLQSLLAQDQWVDQCQDHLRQAVAVIAPGIKRGGV